MAALLRGEKETEIAPFSLDAPILYYPVRHHSPVCAWHLEQILMQYAPDCILVEGPENANDLITVLAHPDTKPPVALYYTCMEKSSAEERSEVCGCYYPFLEHSPELVALRAAAQNNIPCAFIDLPYADIIAASKEAHGFRVEEERISYADDRYLAANAFQKRLCERAGLRSFEEFWEKYFEQGGLFLSSEAFVQQMNRYCLLSRNHTPQEELLEDGCLAREAHMAIRIREAAQQYRKILVVAGGFHIAGLQHPTEQPDPSKREKMTQTVYPIRYTMPAMDALLGYSSGMPSPQFYRSIWDALHRSTLQEAWEDMVLHYFMKTGKALRKKGENISMFDEICALHQVRGLAQLREKPMAGLYELQDAVLSSFVKGEAVFSNCEPLRILSTLTTGNEVGQLCDGSIVPPLIRDFDALCKQYRLRQRDVARLEVTLSVFSQPKHQKISYFLHQTVFLDCGFAQRKKGPSLHHRRDRSLIRETWEYRWTMRVDAALTEQAIYGSTMEEACSELLCRRMEKASHAKEGAHLLLQGFLMGLEEKAQELVSCMEQLLIHDGDFLSLCEACFDLNALSEWQSQYHDGEPHDQLLGRCLRRVTGLLPAMNTVDDQAVEQVQRACLLLYQVTERTPFHEERESFLTALQILIGETPIHPALHGAALGLLYGADATWQESIKQVIEGYLTGTAGMMRRSADFLQGLFYTAKDLILIDGDFLKQIDALLCELSDEVFTEILPQLHLAFSYFVPMETNRLARKAAALHGTSAQELLRRGVDAGEYSRFEQLDTWAAAQLDIITEEGEDEDDE